MIGYTRVGTDDQRLDSQTDAFPAADTNKIFADKICGSKRVRPELNRMPDQLREGDVVIVTKYDRLARSLKEVLETVEATRERGTGFLLGRRHRHDDVNRSSCVCSASPLMGTATSLSDIERSATSHSDTEARGNKPFS